MATNPMQRRSRNSFLLGMLVMLVVAGAIAAFFIYTLMAENAKLKKEQKAEMVALVLAADVKSGAIITDDMFVERSIPIDIIPTNYFNNTSISEFKLKDKKTGSHIGRLKINDTVLTNYLCIEEKGKNVFIDQDINTGLYYRYKADNGDILLDSDGTNVYMYVIDAQNSKLRIVTDGNEYYYNSINGKKVTNMTKEEVEFIEQPMIAKVNLDMNTVLTYDMVTELDEAATDDLRIQEFNMFSLPVKLNVDDYIDIRFTLPNGLDYIVVSKKRVIDVSETTVWLKVSEEEILSLSNAIVESYIMDGSKLTATLFVEPGLQTAATPTYAVSAEVYKLIQNDPNIVQTAKDALKYRFSSSGGNLESQRVNEINGQISQYADMALENVNQKTKQEIDARKEMREKYIKQLNQATTVTQ